MARPELISFIEQETAQGFGVADIKEQLKRGGWQDADIEEGFAEIVNKGLSKKSVVDEAVPVQAEASVATSPATPPLGGATSPVTKPTKHAPISKKLFWIGGVVLVLLVITVSMPLVLGLMQRDMPQSSDTDLQLSSVQVANDKNAYFDMVEAVRQGNIYIGSASTQEKEQAARAMFTAYAAGVNKEFYQDPALADPAARSSSTLSLEDLYKVAGSVNTFALRTPQTGSSTDALSIAIFGAVIGTNIQKSQDTLAAQEIAMNIKEESLRTTLRVATSTTQNSKDLITMAHWVAELTTDGTGLVRADKLEYLKYRNLFTLSDVAARRELGVDFIFTPPFSFFNMTGYFYQPNRTGVLLAEMMRARIQAHSETCEVAVATDTAPFKISLPLGFFAPNSVGAMLLASVPSPQSTAKKQECEIEVLRGGVEIVLALKAFEQDHKTLPKTLDELVPTYLPSVPHGPYSATTTTYKYDPVKRQVYSLGAANTDKGGNVPENPTYSF